MTLLTKFKIALPMMRTYSQMGRVACSGAWKALLQVPQEL
jgi:hypothetical protein